jgi:hypothetical protein
VLLHVHTPYQPPSKGWALVVAGVGRYLAVEMERKQKWARDSVFQKTAFFISRMYKHALGDDVGVEMT